jgi:Kef-type K+ transport system membrane component KefB
MTGDRKLSPAIVLMTAAGLVFGVILAIFRIQPTLGGVVIGLVLGTAAARGYVPAKPKGCK